MEFCVLGLLIMSPMTIYDLNKAFEMYLGLFYSASLGSLRTVCRSLMDRGLADRHQEYFGKRVRKVYQITAAGLSTFRNGFTEPIPSGRLEQTALARLFFLGLIESEEERTQALRIITATIAEALAGLEATREEMDHIRAANAPGSQSVLTYQLKTLEYGIRSHRFALEWFSAIDAATN